MRTLDAEERRHAIDAARLLYNLLIIDLATYEHIIATIEQNTGI